MNESITSALPHHRLRAYGTALRLLRVVRAAGIRDRTLRDQALRAAKGVCLNIAEGAGRVTRGQGSRPGSAVLALEVGAELYAVLSSLIR
jgi:hypothetical protein